MIRITKEAHRALKILACQLDVGMLELASRAVAECCASDYEAVSERRASSEPIPVSREEFEAALGERRAQAG